MGREEEKSFWNHFKSIIMWRSIFSSCARILFCPIYKKVEMELFSLLLTFSPKVPLFVSKDMWEGREEGRGEGRKEAGQEGKREREIRRVEEEEGWQDILLRGPGGRCRLF
jgi:hypothetical protein